MDGPTPGIGTVLPDCKRSASSPKGRPECPPHSRLNCDAPPLRLLLAHTAPDVAFNALNRGANSPKGTIFLRLDGSIRLSQNTQLDKL
ncbi:hypothetical protein NTJ56_09690 [Burkholderia contaminans]|uniref:hypothetical protein n=1 Tax=Burkholderia contaminans TaxID=488447 RepID=UPI001CF52E24|nr:hypothetical protein [Burkholderia contaminans]MCA7918650.1 hypothetical protein [Burkholderia contaminans]MCA8100794.1 hypothetical protein [Burkholderia contaminans]UUX35649.1 hypothetical protein NTJ56_09690 [Burkholderia contaminans]